MPETSETIAGILSLSPLKYWPLNESSGTSAEEYIDGSPNGSESGNSDPILDNPVAGVYSRDFIGGFIDTGIDNDLDLVGDFSLCFDIKIDAVDGGADHIIGNNDGTTCPFQFAIASDYAIRFYHQSAGGSELFDSDVPTPSKVLSTDEWYRVVAGRDISETTLFIDAYQNGVLVWSYSTASLTITPDASTSNLKLGDSNGNAMNGKLANVAVWDRYVTLPERTLLGGLSGNSDRGVTKRIIGNKSF